MTITHILISRLTVNKVTSLSKHTPSFLKKDSTLLSFISGIRLLIFPQLMRSMSKFAFFLIGTIAKLQKFLAKLGFLFIISHSRYVHALWSHFSWRAGVLSRWRMIETFMGNILAWNVKGYLHVPSCLHSILLANYFNH